jgi:hypothetical protein
VLVAALAVCLLALAPTPVLAGLGPDDPPPPPVTVNEFIPEDRDLSDCLSALPKPGCGSEARGGWGQTAVLSAILVGLGVIGWRISVGLRANRRALDTLSASSTADDPVAPHPPT